MDLEKYIELTGETVDASKEAKVNATIRRTRAQLESLLGYSLTPENLYTELGKVQFQGYLPVLNNTDNLLPADEQEGTYKLFAYNEKDDFIHVDPFINLYHVKLVKPLNNGEFITVVDFDNVVAKHERGGIGRFIERYWEWFTWAWYKTYLLSWTSESDAGLMIAVDADWIDCYPDDILYIWADMVTYYSDDEVSVTGNIKSESVDGHSWSRGTTGKGEDLPPQEQPSAQGLLARYVGPYGAIARNPVR